MKKLTTLLCSLSLTFTLSSGARADTVVFATAVPKTDPINVRFLDEWVDRLEESGDLNIRRRTGLSLTNFSNFYDRVVDGVVDMTFGMTLFNPGRFRKSLVFTMPFVQESSEQGSLTACEMYKSGAFGEEFNDIVPLVFGQFPNAMLHTKQVPVDSLNAVDGMKVISNAPPAIEVAEDNGATVLSIDLSDTYQALARNTAEGVIIPFQAFKTFQLGDVLNHSLEVPLGGGLGILFISKSSYDGLDPKARAALDKNSTCEASRQLGAAIDAWNADSRADLLATGHTIVELSDAEIANLRARYLKVYEKKFADNLSGGEAFVNTYFDTMERNKPAL